MRLLFSGIFPQIELWHLLFGGAAISSSFITEQLPTSFTLVKVGEKNQNDKPTTNPPPSAAGFEPHWPQCKFGFQTEEMFT